MLSQPAHLDQSLGDSRLIVGHGLDVGPPVRLASVGPAAFAEPAREGLVDCDNSAVIEAVRRRCRIGRAA